MGQQNSGLKVSALLYLFRKCAAITTFATTMITSKTLQKLRNQRPSRTNKNG